MRYGLLLQTGEGTDLASFTQQLETISRELPYGIDATRLFSYLFELEFQKAWDYVRETIVHFLVDDWLFSKELLVGILGIVIFSILFSRLSEIFQKYSLGDYGFLVAYFLLFLLLYQQFQAICQIFQQTIVTLFTFLKLLLPVYTLAITLTGNVTTGTMTYEYFMVVVMAMQALAYRIFLPSVQYYLLLTLVNHLSKKTKLTNLCDTLYGCLSKGLHFLCVLLFGLHLLELMLSPTFDAAGYKVADKLVGVLPGAGAVAQTMTSGVISSAILIKNALGVTSILLLVLLLFPPIVKMFTYICIYHFLAIVTEPAADSRLLACFTAMKKAGYLLLQGMGILAILFILVLGTTAIATNGML